MLAALFAGGLGITVNELGGVGDRSEAPATAADVPPQYRLAVGAMDLDLRDTRLPRGETTTLSARVGLGSVTVLVPPGVRVESVGATEVDGVADVNRAAREERRRRLAALRRDAGPAASARRAAAPDRPAARRGAARARRAVPTLPPPAVVAIDADVVGGSAKVLAAGG